MLDIKKIDIKLSALLNNNIIDKNQFYILKKFITYCYLTPKELKFINDILTNKTMYTSLDEEDLDIINKQFMFYQSNQVSFDLINKIDKLTDSNQIPMRSYLIFKIVLFGTSIKKDELKSAKYCINLISNNQLLDEDEINLLLSRLELLPTIENFNGGISDKMNDLFNKHKDDNDYITLFKNITQTIITESEYNNSIELIDKIKKSKLVEKSDIDILMTSINKFKKSKYNPSLYVTNYKDEEKFINIKPKNDYLSKWYDGLVLFLFLNIFSNIYSFIYGSRECKITTIVLSIIELLIVLIIVILVSVFGGMALC